MYGLAYDPATRRLFATENSNAERDEVNLIEPGRNYGWPFCEGFVYYDAAKDEDTDRPGDHPRFTAPIGEFYPNTTAAPTGATIFHGHLYWASWNEGAIHRMKEDPATGKWMDQVVYRPGGRINDLEAAPDGGALYYSNWTHILRLDVPAALAEFPAPPPAQSRPADSSRAPATALATAACILALSAGIWRTLGRPR